MKKECECTEEVMCEVCVDELTELLFPKRDDSEEYGHEQED